MPVRSARPTAAAYSDLTTIAGPLRPADENHEVTYRDVLTARERMLLLFLTLLAAGSSLTFLTWLVWPGHAPALRGGWFWLGLLAFAAVITIELVRLAQNATLWLFSWNIRDPEPVRPRPGLRVAILTTIVPAKEPFEIVERTLRAMKQVEYDGTVDVWLLDEGDDELVRQRCEHLGVRHFSRAGRPEYNQPTGQFRARTKSGNHNAWRDEHEGEYDLVAQMDPDHEPFPDFLQRTLGYFEDRDVAFVVAPQVYGNLGDSRLTLAIADQSYLFHGTIQRGGNGLDAPLLIGTNHVYRVTAWTQIGGYQDSIIEDHLTSLVVHGTRNPETGKPWKGVYTPDILAIGEGPGRWSDYFDQQKRWAYGVAEVALTHDARTMHRLSLRQRAAYAGLQLFYPSIGFMWSVGNAVTLAYLAFGVTAVDIAVAPWALLWGMSVVTQIGLFVWLRRLNLAPHERRGTGLMGMALATATAPVYAAATFMALLRRPLTYAVTGKGALAGRDGISTFRLHLAWAAVAAAGLVASAFAGHTHAPLRVWAAVTLAATLLPVLWVAASALLQRDSRQRPTPVGTAVPQPELSLSRPHHALAGGPEAAVHSLRVVVPDADRSSVIDLEPVVGHPSRRSGGARAAR